MPKYGDLEKLKIISPINKGHYHPRDLGAFPKELTTEWIEDTLRREGMCFPAEFIRRSVLGGLGIRKRYGNGENLIIIGCLNFGTALPVRSYFRLLEALDIGYIVLDKEYCCGAPLVLTSILVGVPPREEKDKKVKEFLQMNITQGKELGVKNIAYMCMECIYLIKYTFPKDSNLYYYLDIVLPRLEKENLSVPRTRVGYFGGRPHRAGHWAPGVKGKSDVQWSAYRKLLDRIDGLEVVDISRKFCCHWPGDREKIFEVAREQKVDIIVAPCTICYGGISRLTRKEPQGVRVMGWADLLLMAVAHARKWGAEYFLTY